MGEVWYNIRHYHYIKDNKMPPRRFTDEQEAIIAQEYLDGESQRALARKYGVDRICIKGALRRQGTETRGVSERNRIYALGKPDAFSKIDSEEKAYWWGLFYADGFLYRNTIKLTLKKKDAPHLEKLKDFMQSENPMRDRIHYANGKGYPSVELELSDTQIGKGLRKLGINVGRKNFTKAIQNLPNELAHHWIRGFFDGDGSAKKDQSLSFCGGHILLTWIRDKLSQEVRTNPNLAITKHTTANIYYLSISGRLQALKVADYMYQDATVWMERKRNVINSWPQKRGIIKPPQCKPGYVIKRKRNAGN